MRYKKVMLRFCKGCEYEFDNKKCPHEYKELLLKHSDGSFQMGYCSKYEENK